MRKKETPINQLSDTEPKWFAINTGFRREKSVEKVLKSKGIETFLPIIIVSRQYGRKKKIVHLPLINCYLFVKITKKDYIPVLSTQDVFRFLKIGHSLEAIPEEQINIMRRVIGEGVDVETTNSSLKAGDPVEIIAGNLTGIKGRMTEIKGKNKFVIRLDKIGFDLQMELPANLVRPISERQLEFI